MNVGDIAYWYGYPAKVIRKASPYVFGVLAKQMFVMAEFNAASMQEIEQRTGMRYKTNVFAIPPNRLRLHNE